MCQVCNDPRVKDGPWSCEKKFSHGISDSPTETSTKRQAPASSSDSSLEGSGPEKYDIEGLDYTGCSSGGGIKVNTTGSTHGLHARAPRTGSTHRLCCAQLATLKGALSLKWWEHCVRKDGQTGRLWPQRNRLSRGPLLRSYFPIGWERPSF